MQLLTRPHPSPASALAFLSLIPMAALAAQDLTLPVSLTHGVSVIAAETQPDGTPGGVWACGADYKVSFHDGAVFHPFVGPDLPHQPVRWHTASVRVGGRELLDARTTPAPRWHGTRCEYDHGAVIERYDVLAEGLEQSFVLPAPVGTGELVIVGRLATSLRLDATTTARQQGLTLRLPDGRPLVRYGAAIAIDAAGRRVPVTTSAEGDSIALRLDAAFVADASYPLVVDPLITPVTVENGGRVTDVDVLHESITPANQQARTWIVYSRIAAAGDQDLWIKRVGSSFNGTPLEMHRRLTTWDDKQGRIALCAGNQKTITVFTFVTPAPNSRSYLAVHNHDVSDVVLQLGSYAPFPITFTDEHQSRPAIGGRIDGTSNNVLVTWQRDFDANGPSNTATTTVMAAVYDTGLPGAATSPFVLRNRPGRDQERPAVNRDADGGRWLVAFQEHDPGVANDDWDVGLVSVDESSVVTATNVDLEQANVITQHKLGPQVGGTAGRYLLTYSLRQFELPNPKPDVVLGEEVRAQRIDLSGAGGSRPWPSVRLEGGANAVFAASGVAHDHRSTSHWCATVHNFAIHQLAVHKLGYRGMTVERGTIGPNPEVQLVTGGVCFNTSARSFPLAYGANNGSNNQNRVAGTVMEYVPVTPATTYGFGCGSGVWAGVGAMVDRQQIGAEDLPFRLVNAPVPGAICLLVLSMNQANTPLGSLQMPGCDGLVDLGAGLLGSVFLVLDAAGGASYTLDLPEQIVPFTLHAQWAYRVPAANPAGWLVSEGVRVQIDR